MQDLAAELSLTLDRLRRALDDYQFDRLHFCGGIGPITSTGRARLRIAQTVANDVEDWTRTVSSPTPPPQWFALAREFVAKMDVHIANNAAINGRARGRVHSILASHRAELQRLYDREVVEVFQSKVATRILRRKHRLDTAAVDAAYAKVNSGGLLAGRMTLQAQSAANLAALEAEFRATMPSSFMGSKMAGIFDYLVGDASYYLTHATRQANKDKMLSGNGQIMSNVSLTAAVPGIHTNTFAIDREFFANDDFVFFTLDLEAKHETTYGDRSFVFDAEAMHFFQYGWVSYIDFLSDFPGGGEVYQDVLMTGVCTGVPHTLLRKPQSVVTKQVTTSQGPARYRDDFVFVYPATGRTRTRSLLDMMLFGPAVRRGIALDLVIELQHMGIRDQDIPADPDSRAVFARNALNAVYWLEAKLPSAAYVRFMRPRASARDQFSAEIWQKKA